MLSTSIGAEFGTPQLAANAGLHLRIGKLFNQFKYEDFATNDWTLFFYTKPKFHLCAYNTYLQGGIFTHDQPCLL
jgi:hypothetical protein